MKSILNDKKMPSATVRGPYASINTVFDPLQFSLDTTFKLIDARWFQIFLCSTGTIRIFKVYSQEVKMEEKLNCNRALWNCRYNSRSATYICKAPPGRKMNLQGALIVNCCSATHI
jgi:hypothetical protein